MLLIDMGLPTTLARLHGHQFFVCVEVIVCGQHAGAKQLFLEDGHEVKQVLGLVVADVVDLVRGNGASRAQRPLRCRRCR